jgi:carbonic anhydrase
MLSLRSFWYILLLIPVISANCLHGTTLYKRLLEKRAATTPFGYTNRLSALNWANLDPSYYQCATGLHQSPINLYSGIPFAPKNPVFDIPVLQTATLLNTGVLVEVTYPSTVNGTTNYNGKVYHLEQFHFHTPGEHRLNEEFFPAEMHMVHENVGMSFCRSNSYYR